MYIQHQIFNFDPLANLMTLLILLVGASVSSFSYRYMKGDKNFISFFLKLFALFASVLVMVAADNLIVFFMSWCCNNLLVVSLMIHKSSWVQARNSGMFALKNYALGAFFLSFAFFILYYITGELSIKLIIAEDFGSVFILLSLILLLITSMTQSAIWPFHRWLLSSLNSPTPVSAIMHAGILNGGGFLLARFAPIYFQYPFLLFIISIIGFLTAFLGTLWKLMQTDIKRMLACSTMGQMGFMLAQCGMGLFSAAIGHLIWHGIFKAYLFLSSGSAAQEQKFKLQARPSLIVFLCSLFSGLIGSLSFGYITGESWFAGDTTLIIMCLSFVFSCQLGLVMISQKGLQFFPISCIIVSLVGLLYGFTVHIIAYILEPMKLMQPLQLHIFHILVIFIIFFTWLLSLFAGLIYKEESLPIWVLKFYVFALNASQPYPQTITTCRKDYKYL